MAKRLAPDEKLAVRSYCAALFVLGADGTGKLAWSKEEFVFFKYITSTVTLIFYPHKNSRGNKSCRVRIEGGKNEACGRELIDRLQYATTSMFTQKNKYFNPQDIDDERDYGWLFDVMKNLKDSSAVRISNYR